jgi:hypothetical protein
MITVAIQSQQIEIQDALAIMLEPDTKNAVRAFQRKIGMRKMLEMKQQQEQAQAEQEAQQQQMMLQQQQMQQESQIPIQLQQMKNQGNMEKTLATGRVKLNSQKLDLLNR